MLLTNERIKALSHVSRFAGWTSRTYTVLEHTLIGAKLLADTGQMPHIAVQAFLLHDLHETEFGGDITTPIKQKYMPPEYYEAVRTWDRDLATETGVPLYLIEGMAVKFIDAAMLAAETRTVSTRDWRAHIPEHYDEDVQRAMSLIKSEFYAGERGVAAWWQMWSGR